MQRSQFNLNTSTLKPPPKASVILAFYNKIDFLKLVLPSLEIQTYKNFELIICDDGSREDVLTQCDELFQKSRLSITHLWQPDQGFRKNRILNEGIRTSHSDYLIFIDGDCVLHPHFVEEHVLHQKERTVLSGRRVDLTAWISKKLSADKILNGYLQKNYWWIFWSLLALKDNNAPKGIYLKNTWIRRWVNQKPRGLVGCNFSIFKKDLLDINGFDERYEGPGLGEDTDIELRLRRNDIQVEPFTHTAIQYHLYHQLLERPSKNFEIFEQVRSSTSAKTEYGIAPLKNASH